MSAASLRFNHSSKSTAKLPMGDFPATFQVPTKSLQYARRHSYTLDKKGERGKTKKKIFGHSEDHAQIRSQKLTLTHWSKCMELSPLIQLERQLGSRLGNHRFHFLLYETFDG